MHICYGYGIKANIDWKKTLGAEWRQYEETFPLLARSSIRQVSLECANSHVPIELIGLLEGKDVLVGAIDVATDRVETPEEVAATIRAALKYVPAERLYPCTNCGMVPLRARRRPRQARALGAGAALVRRVRRAGQAPGSALDRRGAVRRNALPPRGRSRGGERRSAPRCPRRAGPARPDPVGPQNTAGARRSNCVSSAKCFVSRQ